MLLKGKKEARGFRERGRKDREGRRRRRKEEQIKKRP